MSGGSHNYGYSKVDDLYVGQMYDVLMNKMMNDLVCVLHDLEWWQSGDLDEEDYRDTVRAFKNKYFFNYKDTAASIAIKEINTILKQVGLE